MKTSLHSMTRTFGTAALVAISLLAFTPDSQAKDKDDKRGPDKDNRSSKSSRGWFGQRGNDSRHDSHRHDDDDRRRFFAQPRTSFRVTLGNGYAGRGYYYGPPNASYYYQGDGVVYYSSRERVPQHYWGDGHNHGRGSAEAALQRALAQRGYYRGPIDGSLGRGSRDAIARFQRDQRLPVTGTMNSATLHAAGIR